MAEADWTELTNSLAAGAVKRGVTNGITPPVDGGNFTHGWNSVVSGVTGAHGRFYNGGSFAPMASGARITGALKRMPSGGTENFAVMLFAGLQSNDVNASGYLIGLQDDDPSRIVLRKGVLSQGLPEGDAADPTAAPNILRQSVDTVAVDEWVHLRLDMVVNGTGDVILKCFKNDVAVNGVAAPVWSAISGMDDFTDDALAINTGTVPLTSGYGGFAFQTSNISRRCAVDYITLARQI